MTSRELASCIDAWHMESFQASWEAPELIQEILEKNAKWWDRAAAHCETIAVCLEHGKKEESLFISGLYRERSEVHAQLLERLRNEERRV